MSGNIDDVVIQSMEDTVDVNNAAVPTSSTAAAAAAGSGSGRQIQIRLRASPSAPHLPAAPDTAFSVPVTLARLGLSELTNHLLGLSPPRPFEFLAKNKFLRTSLERYLTANGLSGEDELVLEYIEALPPPEKDTSTPHPDWISSVDASVGRGQAWLPAGADAATAGKDKKKDKKAAEAAAAEVLVSLQPASFTATGCFDNNVRVWSYGTSATSTSTSTSDSTLNTTPCVLSAIGRGHSAAVKAVRVLRPFDAAAAAGAGGDTSSAVIVSASQDRTLRTWEFAPPTTSTSTTKAASPAGALSCTGVFNFHSGTVESLATMYNPNNTGGALLPSQAARLATPRFVSGGYEGSIAVWEARAEYRVDPEEVKEKAVLLAKAAGRLSKASKIAAAAAGVVVPGGDADAAIPHYRPVTGLVSHKSGVTALAWPHPQHLYSGSLDCTLKHWDLSTAAVVHTWSGGHAILAADFSHALNVVATGEQDGCVRLWDPRAAGAAATVGASLTTTAKGTLKACEAWCVAVKWAPAALDAPHILLSGGYDGQVKFWDIRAAKPLHALPTTSERLFAVDWAPVGDDEVEAALDAGARSFTAAAVAGGTGKVLDRATWKLPLHE